MTRSKGRAGRRKVQRSLCRLFSKMKSRRAARAQRYRKNIPIQRKSWEDHIQELKKDEFLRRYRLPADKFEYLLQECAKNSPYFRKLTPQQQQSQKNFFGCEGIDPRHKLAAALRYFAGGSYLDIRLVHGMSQSSVLRSVWETVDAIHASEALDLKFPWNDESKLQELEKGFAELSEGNIRGCVFSVDGFCVRIICPTGVNNARDYWHRKKFYALVVQAVVDAKGKFMAASFKAVGSTHDSLAFKMSAFYEKLKSGILERPTGLAGLRTYFGVGDDAYENSPFLATPWPSRNLPMDKDSYNYWQSRIRIVVECAFGRLTKRWGCLWRALSVSPQKVPALVCALMKLHNLADLADIKISHTDLQKFARTRQTPCVFVNDELSRREISSWRVRRRVESAFEDSSSTRQALTDHIANKGAARPPHSRYRARTKQTARKSSSATEEKPRPRRRPKNYHWTKTGSKKSRRAAREARKRRAESAHADTAVINLAATLAPAEFVYSTPPPRKRRADSTTDVAATPVAATPAPADAVNARAVRKKRRKLGADFAANARRNLELDPALKARAVDTLAKLMSMDVSASATAPFAKIVSMDVPASATAPLRSVRSRYTWSGGSTTLHYPVRCRPRLAYVKEREIAESLVDSDVRIPPACPPPAADVWTTDGAVIYQYKRANILREILIDVTAAYNIATGQPARELPKPPVVDPGVSPTSDTESDSEEDGYKSMPFASV